MREKNYLFILSILLLFQSFGQTNKSAFLPIVFVHGMLASGDTWTLQFQRFEQQGYTSNQLEVVDWNTVGFGKSNINNIVDSVINKVLQITGASQVNLVGHSAGGGVCLNYLNKPENAAKVAHYAHIGSGKIGKVPSVATMNIYSLNDKISGGSDINGVTNIALQKKDHYEVATSIETFNALFQFFNKTAPVNSLPESAVFNIAGKAVSFGENVAEINAKVEIFELDAATGKRKKQKSVFTTKTDSLGKWEGFRAKPNMYYEFVVTPEQSEKRIVHYYREPFTANNPLVYLRVLGSAGMAAMNTKKLPVDNNQSVLAIFSANHAIINERDSLMVNDVVLSNQKFASAAKTAIAFFLFDDGDAQTSANTHAGMGMFPFINMIDAFIPAGKKNIQLYFNGRKMVLPSLASAKDGIMVAVFD